MHAWQHTRDRATRSRCASRPIRRLAARRAVRPRDHAASAAAPGRSSRRVTQGRKHRPARRSSADRDLGPRQLDGPSVRTALARIQPAECAALVYARGPARALEARRLSAGCYRPAREVELTRPTRSHSSSTRPVSIDRESFRLAGGWLIPDRLAIPYLADDLYWALFRRGHAAA